MLARRNWRSKCWQMLEELLMLGCWQVVWLSACERTVNTCEQILEASRWREGSNEIHVDMVELGICGWKLTEWGHGVLCCLGALTCQTCTSPLADIMVHVQPHKPGTSEMQCCSNVRISKGTEEVEHMATENGQNKRARGAGRCVNNEIS